MMADTEDDTLELETPIEGEEQEAPEQQQGEDDGELHIEIEGEEEPEEETPLIKDLRTKLRESQKREAEARKSNAPAEIVVGKKPDLWDDCEGDPDKFEAELLAWTKRSAEAEKQKQATTQVAEAAQAAFQKSFAIYRAKAETIGVKNFQEAEDKVVAALPVTVQSAIVKYAKNPAQLVAGLGLNPGALAKVAAEDDPLRQILMVMEMENKMTVGRKKPPPPEADTIQRGSVSVAATSDKQLEKLEKEAARTNDRSKVIAYKASLKKT